MNKELTVEQVMKECQISRATLYRLLNEGLPYIQVGVRSKRFNPDVVKEFIANRERGIQLKSGDILPHSELPSIFYCSSTGEVRKSNRQNAIVIISNKNSQKLFCDYWDGNIFYFLLSDQHSDLKSCEVLDYAIEHHSIIHLFETVNENELIYRGNIKSLNKEIIMQPISGFSEMQDERTEKVKVIYVFELINDNILIPEEIIRTEERELFKEMENMKKSILKMKAEANQGVSSKRMVSKIRYETNKYVAQYVLKQSGGICNLCHGAAPFVLGGMGYLEVHHIIPLHKGGKDTIENTVALCPNCHKKIHLIESNEDIEKLYFFKDIIDEYVEVCKE